MLLLLLLLLLLLSQHHPSFRVRTWARKYWAPWGVVRTLQVRTKVGWGVECLSRLPGMATIGCQQLAVQADGLGGGILLLGGGLGSHVKT
jgi:hypothetical protein